MPTIADLLIAQGQNLAGVRRRRGERAGAIVTSLGQIPAAIVEDRDARRAAQVAAQRQAAADARAQTSTDIAVSAENRALSAADRQAQEAADAKTAEQRGREAVQGWLKQHSATIGPEATDRISAVIQTPDGLAKAIEVLSKAPEPMKLVEHDPTKALANPQTGAIVTAAVPEAPKPVTFSEPKAVTVNGRKTTARPGSDGNWYVGGKKLDGDVQLYEKPEGSTDALDKQTEWAIAPGETEPRLMTKAEIRTLGAKRPAGADKPSSGVQKRVLNFFNRAQQADTDLEGFEGQIQQQGLLSQGWQALAPNFMQTQLGQSYTAAQRAFTEARLRKDSGAAIPKEEFDSDRKTYFTQPGDSPATLEQKRRARGAMLASLAFESGQALGEYLGDAAEASATIQKFKDRAAGKGAAAGGGNVRMRAPDGRELSVPPAEVARMKAAGAKEF